MDLYGLVCYVLEDLESFKKGFSLLGGAFYLDGNFFVYRRDGVSFGLGIVGPKDFHTAGLYHLLTFISLVLRRLALKSYKFWATDEGISYMGYQVAYVRLRGVELDSLFSRKGLVKAVSFGRLSLERKGNYIEVVFNNLLDQRLQGYERYGLRKFLQVNMERRGYRWV